MRTRDEIGAWLDALHARLRPVGVVAVDPEDAGVPPDMQLGAADAEGWVAWRNVPCTLAPDALAPLEARVGPLPPALDGWLCARHHLFGQVTTGAGHLLMLPTTPTDAPLRALEETIDAWGPLLGAGFLPIGDFDAGAGPLCLDLGARTPEGDAPIVWIDHEALFALGEDAWADRAAVAPLARPLYASFEALLDDVTGAA